MSLDAAGLAEIRGLARSYSSRFASTVFSLLIEDIEVRHPQSEGAKKRRIKAVAPLYGINKGLIVSLPSLFAGGDIPRIDREFWKRLVVFMGLQPPYNSPALLLGWRPYRGLRQSNPSASDALYIPPL